MYEMPPSAIPSSTAYSGAVIGARFGLNDVTKATTSAAIAPPKMIALRSRFGTCRISYHVYPALAAARSTRANDYHAEPAIVMTPVPPSARARAIALSENAGFENAMCVAMDSLRDVLVLHSMIPRATRDGTGMKVRRMPPSAKDPGARDDHDLRVRPARSGRSHAARSRARPPDLPRRQARHATGAHREEHRSGGVRNLCHRRSIRTGRLVLPGARRRRYGSAARVLEQQARALLLRGLEERCPDSLADERVERSDVDRDLEGVARGSCAASSAQSDSTTCSDFPTIPAIRYDDRTCRI